MNITLDTNAVIALENNEPDAIFLRPLLTLHQEERITLYLGLSTYLEPLPMWATDPPEIFHEKRIAAAGLNIPQVHLYEHPHILAFSCRTCGALFYDERMSSSYAACIHRVMCGEQLIDFSFHAYRRRREQDPEEAVRKKWHNTKNDTLGLYEHVTWGGDIFVTSDRQHFLNKRSQLAVIVPGKILTPQETLETLNQLDLTVPRQEMSWLPRVVAERCYTCFLKAYSEESSAMAGAPMEEFLAQAED